MSSGNTVSTVFGGLKDMVVDHLKETWSPFKRTEGNSLVKDIFSDSTNIQKLGIRVLHVALATLIGLNLLAVASALIVNTPVALHIIIGLTCTGFAGGMVLTFFPEKIEQLISLVAKQINKLKS